MTNVGTFHIEASFKIAGRGLVAVGDLTSGHVRIGDFVTVNTGEELLTLQICSIESGRRSEQKNDFVGLLFHYPTQKEREWIESIKLPEQDVQILRPDG